MCCLKLWRANTFHQYKIFIVIIIFFVLVRWEIQMVKVPANCSKNGNLRFQNKFSNSRTDKRPVTPFPLLTITCRSVLPYTMVTRSSLNKCAHACTLLTEKNLQLFCPGVESISILYDETYLFNSIIGHALCRTTDTVAWAFAMACFQVIPSSRNSKELITVCNGIEYVFVTGL